MKFSEIANRLTGIPMVRDGAIQTGTILIFIGDGLANPDGEVAITGTTTAVRNIWNPAMKYQLTPRLYQNRNLSSPRLRTIRQRHRASLVPGRISSRCKTPLRQREW